MGGVELVAGQDSFPTSSPAPVINKTQRPSTRPLREPVDAPAEQPWVDDGQPAILNGTSEPTEDQASPPATQKQTSHATAAKSASSWTSPGETSSSPAFNVNVNDFIVSNLWSSETSLRKRKSESDAAATKSSDGTSSSLSTDGSYGTDAQPLFP